MHGNGGAFSPSRIRVHPDKDAWRKELGESPVRIQWDPDRSNSLEPLAARAIQVGLSGEAVERYLRDWIVKITDITDLVHSIHSDTRQGRMAEAMRKLPIERHYPLPDQVRLRIGADA